MRTLPLQSLKAGLMLKRGSECITIRKVVSHKLFFQTDANRGPGSEPQQGGAEPAGGGGGRRPPGHQEGPV